jgi:hypothetical protein
MHYRMGLKANAIQIHVISGIAKWFFHEKSWFGQFRHALSKYEKKNIPSWLSFRDIYHRIATNFRQIFKIRIFLISFYSFYNFTK